MSKYGESVANAFYQLVQNWPEKARSRFAQMVHLRAEEFRSVLKAVGTLAFIKNFHEVYDEALAEDKTLFSCGKGCHHCCRQNIRIYEGEAAVIAEYCQKNKIAIPRKYLEQQLKYSPEKVIRSDVGWCVFFKGWSMFNICRKTYGLPELSGGL